MKDFKKFFWIFSLLILCIGNLEAKTKKPPQTKPPEKQKMPYKLSVGAIFNNEAPWLKEWIEYHRVVGVEHFFLYNNRSTDNYEEVLKPYINQGVVTLINWPFGNESNYIPLAQVPAYNDVFVNYGHLSEWIAVIDTDEFLVPIIADNLNDILDEYKQFGGVVISWQMFGTSFVKKIPSNQLLIETLLLKAPKDNGHNLNVKTIMRPECVIRCDNPHYFVYKSGFFAVNTDKNFIEGPLAPVRTNVIQLNHYWTRDDDYFFNYKIPRRKAWTAETRKQWDQMYTEFNTMTDDAILRFVPELRKRMGLQ